MGDNVAVIDHDDDFIKAGYANPEREPPIVTPSMVRRAADAASDGGDAGGGEMLRTIAGRRVMDWDQLEAIYSHIFYRQMGWVVGDEGPALVTEPLFTSKADRERLTQMMFESFNVSGLYIAEQPVMALYGVGKVTGVAVDVGYATTDVSPVVEGAMVIPAAQRIDIGSSHVSATLERMLKARQKGPGVGETPSLNEAALDAVRNAVGVVATSRETLEKLLGSGYGLGSPVEGSGGDGAVSAMTTTHTLPDGNVITVDGAARHGIVESLFQPKKYGLREGPGLSDALHASVMACTNDQRRAVLDAVAVSGLWAGGAGSKAGLDARVLGELEDAMTPSMKPLGTAVPEYMPDRTASFASWIGGSILAKVVFPQNQHITKVDYQENGPSVASKSRVN